MIQTETLYTINELAGMHRLSRRTIIRLYEKEEGVLPLTRVRNGRIRRTWRIPHRVYLRIANKIKERAPFC